ncbi:hypothetical protein [Streptomyces sp. AK02-04a]|uniref:hypothetical protein n=1 Tax=Streptomyces sp. AK02-04a TaxID=3028649 RepID=UPI0029B73117|nr:hypothetical protein [Streptomyces sp. AK02-04a]MDX3759338.1 hypothetical protein [Streptomyces sp. AK02-04a]
MTQEAPPPVDPGNAMLAETPAQMTCALVDTPRGQRMAMTVRTASTTLTVLLARDDARAWGQQISNGAEQMSGLILAGAGALPVNGHETGVDR